MKLSIINVYNTFKQSLQNINFGKILAKLIVVFLIANCICIPIGILNKSYATQSIYEWAESLGYRYIKKINMRYVTDIQGFYIFTKDGYIHLAYEFDVDKYKGGRPITELSHYVNIHANHKRLTDSKDIDKQGLLPTKGYRIYRVPGYQTGESIMAYTYIWKMYGSSGGSKDYSHTNIQTKESWLDEGPPSTPGSFSNPTSSSRLKERKSYKIDWGNSDDEEGDHIEYELQFYDGTNWSTVNSNISGSSCNWTVPTNIGDMSNAQFKVRAIDPSGSNSYSSYRYSSNFEIYQNSSPTISITKPSENEYFSEQTGHNTISIEGHANDADNGDNITVKYTLHSVDNNKDVAGHTDAEILNVVSDGTNKSFNNNITVDNTIAEGKYTLSVWSVDNKGKKSSVVGKNITVDKTHPEINEIDLSSTLNSIAVDCTASDEVGLAEKPYLYTIEGTSSDWVNNSSYAFIDLLPNRRYKIKTEVSDKVGNTNSSAKYIYTKAEVPTITVNNPTSITLDLTIEDNNSSDTAYQIVNTSNNNYISPSGEETTSPTWIIPQDKKITITGLTPEKTYTYKVRAKNGEGIETEFSSPVSSTTLAPPPGMIPEVTATATSNEITIHWNPIDNATSYEVKADDEIIDNGTNVSFTHTELLPGTEHTYCVRAKNGQVVGEWSDAISKSTLPLAPVIPTNINTLSTGSTITLTWSAVGNTTSYDIEVDGEVISNGNSTNYVHTGLLPNTTHGYRVRSINPAGKSEWSDEITAKTQEDSLLIPTNITVNSGKTSIEIRWDEIIGMEYQVEADGNMIDNDINTVYKHSGLTPDSEHTYRVRTYKAGSYSDWSSLLTVSTKPDTFSKPSNIESSATDTTITITWEAVTNADGYDIEIDGNVINNDLDTSFTHSGLPPNTKHTYRIRAKQEDTLSEWSDLLNVTTFALPTPNSVIATITESQIIINWDTVGSATSYEIKIDDNLIRDINDTTYTVSGLNPVTQHKIQVRAVNEDGTSSLSVPIIVTTMGSNNEMPRNITAISKKDKITLMWEQIQGAKSYDIDIAGEVISEIASNIYTHEGLEANTSYTYKIRVNKTEDTSEWSEPIIITTMPIAPPAPQNITASSTMDAVRITWDGAENAQEYEIETNGQIKNVGVSTSYLITGLTPNTEYTYKVRAKNQTSVSSWSTPITIKTKSSIQEYNLQGSVGEESNIILNALSIKSWNNYTFTITYNPEEIEIVDICSQTSRQDQSLGNIIGSDIEVTQNVPGTLQFKKLSNVPMGQTYSGIINSIKIKFKTDVAATITYTIQ